MFLHHVVNGKNDNYEDWLTADADTAFELIQPYPVDHMVVHQSGEGLKSDRDTT